jgi:hypothetical protein
MITSPTRSRSGLMCLRPWGVDCVADIQALLISFLTTRTTGVDPHRPAQTVAPPVGSSSPKRDDQKPVLPPDQSAALIGRQL